MRVQINQASRGYLPKTVLPKPILCVGCVLKLHQTLRRNNRQVTLKNLGNYSVTTGTRRIPEPIPPEHDPEIGITFG